jgi:hypothetical protein
MYTTMWFESHAYFESLENNNMIYKHPKTEIVQHSQRMEEDLLDFITIFELQPSNCIKDARRQLMKKGIMPALQTVFYSKPWQTPIKIKVWYNNISHFISHKLSSLKESGTKTYLTVTTTNDSVQLTFYPLRALPPLVHLRVHTGRYFLTYNPIPMMTRAATAEIACLAKIKKEIKNNSECRPRH